MLNKLKNAVRNFLITDTDLPWVGTSATPSGINVTEDSAMRQATVWGCLRVISENFAQLPLDIYKREDNGDIHIAHDFHVQKLLKRPNQYMTPTEFKKNQILSILLSGNRYAEIKRNKKGKIIKLIPISADRVSKDHIQAERGVILYNVTSGDKVKKIKFENMFKGIGMSQDGINGLSPIAMHRETIGHAVVAAEHGSKILAQGGLPSVALIGDIKDKNHRDKVRTEFNERYAKGGGGCAILPSTWSVESMKISNEDMQYLDSRKFQRAEIAGGIFGVPLHFLGDLEKATLNNVEQQSLEFVTYCLMPYLIAYEEAINRDLLTENETDTYFAKFNVSGFMRGDSESRANYYDKMIRMGVFTINEVRQFEQMNKIYHESADALYKQVNEANITKKGKNNEEQDRNNNKKQRGIN